MGKFNVAGSNQISELDQLTAGVDLPTGPVQEEASQSPQSGGGSILEGIVADAGSSEIGGIVEEGINAGLEREQQLEEQRKTEAVPDIISRRDDETTVNTYDYNEKIAKKEQARKANLANDGVDPHGGLSARAKNMADTITNKSVGLGGLTAAASNPIKQTFETVGALDPEGNLDKGFLQMASVVTENTIATLAFGEGVDNVEYDAITGDQVEFKPTEQQIKGQAPISKALGNAALGKQIHREYQRYKNTKEGKPSDEYTDLPTDQATILGDVAKELYYETNKGTPGNEFLLRGKTDDGKQTVFTLTKHGADLLKKGASLRKKMFPTQHVRPAKTPTPGGQLVKEGRVYTKKVSSKVRKPLAGAEVINEAMVNLNKVANVVDKQRLKILLATAIPVLNGTAKPDSAHAIINNVGSDQYNKFVAKGEKDANFDVNQTYESLISDLAQNIYGIAKERKGANHLTYYMQAFNGRIAPQQTHFDPTTSKAVRFVTRNAVPAVANPGSRIERNLRQMYAMMLVKGADKKLPAEREKSLERATPQLVKWGKQLKASLDAIPDATIEAAAAAIEQGVAVTDPNFPQVPLVSLKDPELIQAIKDKGEDGQAFIDGVVDFTNYYEKKLKGLPHASYFNAYMDGKTNGLAGNGIQMGSEKMAYKTGVLRSQKELLLDNNEDIRDELANMLAADITTNGFDGAVSSKFNDKIVPIAAKLYADKTLNKATTMTFGYGMELGSMKPVLAGRLDELAEGDPELKADLRDAVGNDPDNRRELDEALHSKYVNVMPQVLDEDALASRALMRSAALIHGLTNELFSLRTATGFELNLGGTETTGYEAGDRYKVWTGNKYEERTAATYGEQSTAAATKRRTDAEGNVNLEVGGLAYGGSVPGPVQSLDAATVALTASGKSWAKLRNASQGNPYLHTIYDAFKVDAMGYDVVLDEVNKNWLDAGMNWSYLEETRNALASLREKWTAKSSPFSDHSAVPENEFKMAKYLLDPVATQKGGVFAKNLLNKMNKLLDSADPDAGFKATTNILNKMAKVGYNYKKPPAQPTYKHLRTLLAAVSAELNLNNRLNAMINRTNEKKAKLKAKIKADGNKVYQYYSH